MKRKYSCDICGKEFDTEMECERHEKECSRVDLLEKRVKELEDKVGILEKYLEIMTMPSHASPPSCPNSPMAPNNPYNPPVWCYTVTEEKTTYDCIDAKSEEKAYGKPKA